MSGEPKRPPLPTRDRVRPTSVLKRQSCRQKIPNTQSFHCPAVIKHVSAFLNPMAHEDFRDSSILQSCTIAYGRIQWSWRSMLWYAVRHNFCTCRFSQTVAIPLDYVRTSNAGHFQPIMPILPGFDFLPLWSSSLPASKVEKSKPSTAGNKRCGTPQPCSNINDFFCDGLTVPRAAEIVANHVLQYRILNFTEFLRMQRYSSATKRVSETLKSGTVSNKNPQLKIPGGHVVCDLRACQLGSAYPSPSYGTLINQRRSPV